MTVRLSMSSLAGRLRALVAVGTSRLDSMLVTTRATAPRIGVVVTSLCGPERFTAGVSLATGVSFPLRGPGAAGLLAAGALAAGLLSGALLCAGALGGAFCSGAVPDGLSDALAGAGRPSPDVVEPPLEPVLGLLGLLGWRGGAGATPLAGRPVVLPAGAAVWALVGRGALVGCGAACRRDPPLLLVPPPSK